ncbi:hypothetical protein STEG23_003020 [Scotinomys teguina]
MSLRLMASSAPVFESSSCSGDLSIGRLECAGYLILLLDEKIPEFENNSILLYPLAIWCRFLTHQSSVGYELHRIKDISDGELSSFLHRFHSFTRLETITLNGYVFSDSDYWIETLLLKQAFNNGSKPHQCVFLSVKSVIAPCTATQAVNPKPEASGANEGL